MRAIPILLGLSFLLTTLGSCTQESDETCMGTPQACSTFEGGLCGLQDGCQNANDCDGTPDACDSMIEATGCGWITGCTWDGSACIGTPTPCVDLGYDGCHAFGCIIDPLSCTGTPTPCEDYDEEFYCTSHDGCTWE